MDLFRTLVGGIMRSYERQDTPRASTRPHVRDLEWASGFVEGEGNFGRTPTSERVTVPQVQREPLDRLQRLFGGKILVQRERGPHNSKQWYWRVHGSRARGVMLTLYSLMSTKRREQIRNALATRI